MKNKERIEALERRVGRLEAWQAEELVREPDEIQPNDRPACVPDGAPWQEFDGHVMWFDGDGVSVFDEKAPKFPWLYRYYSSSVFAGALGQPIADACERFLQECRRTRETCQCNPSRGYTKDNERKCVTCGLFVELEQTRETEVGDELDRLRAENERLWEALRECSDTLERATLNDVRQSLESAIAIASAALEAES